MFETLVSALIPITFIMMIGYAARKKEYVGAGTGQVLSNVVLRYTLPALLFYTFATANVYEFWNTDFVIGILVTVLLSFLITFKFSKMMGETSEGASIASLAAAWPNTVFLGIPLLVFLFGEKAMLPIALGTFVITLSVFPLSIFFLERNLGKSTNIIIKAGLHKNPIIISSILGMAVSLLGIHLSTAVLNCFSLLGKPTSTLALFATGIAMAEYKIVFQKDVLLNVAIKNLIQPIIGLFIIWIFNLHGFWAVMLLLNLACPPANTPVMFAYKYSRYESEAVSTIVMGTLFFIFTIFIFYPISTFL